MNTDFERGTYLQPAPHAPLVRHFILPGSDNAFAKFDLAIDLPVTLHLSACADGRGWELLSCGEWTAVPRAFSPELLGSPNPGVDWHSTFRTSMQVYERMQIAMISVETTDGLGVLPARFFTESLPIESLWRWQQQKVWTETVLMHEDIDYTDS